MKINSHNNKEIKERYCIYCGEILSEEETRECKNDVSIYAHNECRNKRCRELHRQRRIGTLDSSGKQITLTGHKRQYPLDEKCEICNTFIPKCLNYHHWDDTNIPKGMWLCSKCHIISNGIEEYLQNTEFFKKYLELRKQIYLKNE